jgi:hypothetical protein
MTTRGHSAVMASRREPPDSLDFFPTPPWATRALCEHVLKPRFGDLKAFGVGEPAAGERHMSDVLAEYFGRVWCSDVFDYGQTYEVGSFVGQGADVIKIPWPTDFIVTNPPFNLALQFAERAIAAARLGVCLLLRTAWKEGVERYRFRQRHPVTLEAQFAERVPMVKGRWDPDASSATAYCWYCWFRDRPREPPFDIPPGQRVALTRPDDAARFAPSIERQERHAQLPMPLFGGGR